MKRRRGVRRARGGGGRVLRKAPPLRRRNRSGYHRILDVPRQRLSLVAKLLGLGQDDGTQGLAPLVLPLAENNSHAPLDVILAVGFDAGSQRFSALLAIAPARAAGWVRASVFICIIRLPLPGKGSLFAHDALCLGPAASLGQAQGQRSAHAKQTTGEAEK
jgi:hypothetical protein